MEEGKLERNKAEGMSGERDSPWFQCWAWLFFLSSPLLPHGKVCGVGDGEKQMECERCRFALV